MMARRFGRRRIARPAEAPAKAAPRKKFVLEVGARVKSVKVGMRPAFIGKITGKWYAHQWFVDDESGRGWVRHSNELSDPGDEK